MGWGMGGPRAVTFAAVVVVVAFFVIVTIIVVVVAVVDIVFAISQLLSLPCTVKLIRTSWELAVFFQIESSALVQLGTWLEQNFSRKVFSLEF